jgi:hypothetical protein
MQYGIIMISTSQTTRFIGCQKGNISGRRWTCSQLSFQASQIFEVRQEYYLSKGAHIGTRHISSVLVGNHEANP